MKQTITHFCNLLNSTHGVSEAGQHLLQQACNVAAGAVVSNHRIHARNEHSDVARADNLYDWILRPRPF